MFDEHETYAQLPRIGPGEGGLDEAGALALMGKRMIKEIEAQRAEESKKHFIPTTPTDGMSPIVQPSLSKETSRILNTRHHI